MSRLLGTTQPFYGLQAQGLDGQSPPPTRIEDIATHYIALIRTVQPEGPYCLGGHSFGGRVAFEMARQLMAQGESIQVLAILDTTAPLPNQPSREQPAWTETQWYLNLASVLEGVFGVELGITEETVHPLTLAQQWQLFQERSIQAGILSPHRSDSHLQGLLQLYKANVLSFGSYVVHQSLPVPITLFRATEYPVEATESNTLQQDPTYGWDQLSTLSVKIHTVAGNHTTMMAQPQVQDLAHKLAQTLAMD